MGRMRIEMDSDRVDLARNALFMALRQCSLTGINPGLAIVEEPIGHFSVTVDSAESEALDLHGAVDALRQQGFQATLYDEEGPLD